MMQEFVHQVRRTVKEMLEGIHTVCPGKITGFDSDTCLASVLPVMKYKTPDGEMIDYPELTGVPVVFPQAMGQKATLAMPIKTGDGCLVVFSEQALDYWMYGQETATDLRFDLTNAICIPGLFASNNDTLKEACATNSVVIDVNGTRLNVKDGSVSIKGNVHIEGNLTITGDLIR